MTGTFDLDRIGGRTALRDLVDEVERAGEDALRLQRAGAGARYESKPDTTPVTEADRAVETRLRRFCAERFPDVPLLGEEEGETGTDADAALRFIVDPIDGTRPFIRGLPTWSILVGLEDARGPALGIALMPGRGDLFVGVRGDGAYGNGRPLHVSAVSSVAHAFVCHGGLEQFTAPGFDALLPRIASHGWMQRGLGDMEGYRQVLRGTADAMLDVDVEPWDLCAPAVLVREAGGRFTSLEGGDTIHAGTAVASNGALHAELLRVLQG